MKKQSELYFPFFRIGHILLDLILILAIYISVFGFRFDWNIPQEHLKQFWQFFPFLPLIRLISNYIFGLYQHIWQYFGIREMIAVIKSVTLGSVIFILAVYLTGNTGFPRSVFLFEWALIIIALGGVRFSKRFSQEIMKVKSKQMERTLIIGAGDAGEMLVRDILKHPHNGFLPAGFIDDDKAKWKARIHGVKVFGGRLKIPDIVTELDIEVIVIAIPSASPKVIREIVEICSQTKAKMQILPAIHEIIHGNVNVSHVRQLRLEDLLGRAQVVISDKEVADSISHKSIMVTGAGGSIGSELCRQLAGYNPSVMNLLGHGENSIYRISNELSLKYPNLKINKIVADIRDAAAIESVMKEFKPHIIFHAAAHKHLPLMEDNIREAISNNIKGTNTIARLADKYNVESFVNISTDKAVNPISIMGMTKRIAEFVVQNQSKKSNTKFKTVRFGNVIGSRGSVIPLFEQQINSGGPVTVTHPEMTRYFMTIPEAVQLVLQASVLGTGGEIFILDMGEPVKILDLAQTMIRLSGFGENDIPITFTGIRYGEKMHEKLVEECDETKETKYNKIFICQCHDKEVKPLEEDLDNLFENLYNWEDDIIKDELQKLITKHSSKN